MGASYSSKQKSLKRKRTLKNEAGKLRAAIKRAEAGGKA